MDQASYRLSDFFRRNHAILISRLKWMVGIRRVVVGSRASWNRAVSINAICPRIKIAFHNQTKANFSEHIVARLEVTKNRVARLLLNRLPYGPYRKDISLSRKRADNLPDEIVTAGIVRRAKIRNVRNVADFGRHPQRLVGADVALDFLGEVGCTHGRPLVNRRSPHFR